MRKKTTYVINRSDIGHLERVVAEIIADTSPNAVIRSIEFHQDCYGDGAIQNTEFEITVEAP